MLPQQNSLHFAHPLSLLGLLPFIHERNYLVLTGARRAGEGERGRTGWSGIGSKERERNAGDDRRWDSLHHILILWMMNCFSQMIEGLWFTIARKLSICLETSTFAPHSLPPISTAKAGFLTELFGVRPSARLRPPDFLFLFLL